ncbi:hypothetical protein HOC01_01400 [archaeon]|jgi:hypothetical protein|nr:hypothetical protein [archaeon]MBT6698024.1 hypothetical protein [archaeon]
MEKPRNKLNIALLFGLVLLPSQTYSSQSIAPTTTQLPNPKHEIDHSISEDTDLSTYNNDTGDTGDTGGTSYTQESELNLNSTVDTLAEYQKNYRLESPFYCDPDIGNDDVCDFFAPYFAQARVDCENGNPDESIMIWSNSSTQYQQRIFLDPSDDEFLPDLGAVPEIWNCGENGELSISESSIYDIMKDEGINGDGLAFMRDYFGF